MLVSSLGCSISPGIRVPRSASQQILATEAIDRALERFEFPDLKGKKGMVHIGAPGDAIDEAFLRTAISVELFEGEAKVVTTAEEVNFFLLIIAGNETTRNSLSGGIQALCEHPEQFDRLRRDPSLLPQAIEEILRWVSPVMQFRRTAMRDTKIADREIRKGDKVVMYYGAANRDPRVFDDPEVFDITRRPNPHLAFGVGTHFCMGSHIARLEMRVTLEEFLRRFPNVSLAGPPERLQSNFISGIKRLPVNLV